MAEGARLPPRTHTPHAAARTLLDGGLALPCDRDDCSHPHFPHNDAAAT